MSATCPADHIVKENEKLDDYLDLAREQKNYWTWMWPWYQPYTEAFEQFWWSWKRKLEICSQHCWEYWEEYYRVEEICGQNSVITTDYYWSKKTTTTTTTINNNNNNNKKKKEVKIPLPY